MSCMRVTRCHLFVSTYMEVSLLVWPSVLPGRVLEFRAQDGTNPGDVEFKHKHKNTTQGNKTAGVRQLPPSTTNHPQEASVSVHVSLETGLMTTQVPRGKQLKGGPADLTDS